MHSPPLLSTSPSCSPCFWSMAYFPHLFLIAIIYFVIIFATLSLNQYFYVSSKSDSMPLYRFHLFGPVGDYFFYSLANGTALYGLVSLIQIIIYPPNGFHISFTVRVTKTWHWQEFFFGLYRKRPNMFTQF